MSLCLGCVFKYRPFRFARTVALPFGRGYLNSDCFILDGTERFQKVNERAMVGVSLFFNNRIAEAEVGLLEGGDCSSACGNVARQRFFETEMKRHAMFALGYGTLAFVRAMMTW